ncbi:MAG: hypothetical protein IJ545_03485 [Alphaproteobacteria bacterium]|nr:hypothetical protein [Alphaproteobacteria bacterium]
MTMDSRVRHEGDQWMFSDADRHRENKWDWRQWANCSLPIVTIEKEARG